MRDGRFYFLILKISRLFAQPKSADWSPGEPVIIKPTVSNELAAQLFPQGFETLKPYFRKTPDPSVVRSKRTCFAQDLMF